MRPPPAADKGSITKRSGRKLPAPQAVSNFRAPQEEPSYAKINILGLFNITTESCLCDSTVAIPVASTKRVLDEHLLFQRRPRRKV